MKNHLYQQNKYSLGISNKNSLEPPASVY